MIAHILTLHIFIGKSKEKTPSVLIVDTNSSGKTVQYSFTTFARCLCPGENPDSTHNIVNTKQ